MAKKRTPSENVLAMIDSLEMQQGQARADMSAEIYQIKQMMKPVNILKAAGSLVMQRFLKKEKKGLVNTLISRVFNRKKH